MAKKKKTLAVPVNDVEEFGIDNIKTAAKNAGYDQLLVLPKDYDPNAPVTFKEDENVNLELEKHDNPISNIDPNLIFEGAAGIREVKPEGVYHATTEEVLKNEKNPICNDDSDSIYSKAVNTMFNRDYGCVANNFKRPYIGQNIPNLFVQPDGSIVDYVKPSGFYVSSVRPARAEAMNFLKEIDGFNGHDLTPADFKASLIGAHELNFTMIAKNLLEGMVSDIAKVISGWCAKYTITNEDYEEAVKIRNKTEENGILPRHLMRTVDEIATGRAEIYLSAYNLPGYAMICKLESYHEISGCGERKQAINPVALPYIVQLITNYIHSESINKFKYVIAHNPYLTNEQKEEVIIRALHDLDNYMIDIDSFVGETLMEIVKIAYAHVVSLSEYFALPNATREYGAVPWSIVREYDEPY